ETQVVEDWHTRGAGGRSQADSGVRGAELLATDHWLWNLLRIRGELASTPCFEQVILPPLGTDISLVDARQASATRGFVRIPHALRAATERDANMAGDPAVGAGRPRGLVGVDEEQHIAGQHGIPANHIAYLPNLFGGADGSGERNPRVTERAQDVERTIDVVDAVGRRIESIRHT